MNLPDRICENPNCGKSFKPTSRVQRCCGKSSCRVAIFRAAADRELQNEWRRQDSIERQERVAGLLAFMGAEERCESSPSEFILQSRTCQCNGHHFRVFDQDGDPYCLGCGKPLKGGKDRGWSINPEIANLMRQAWS